MSSCWCRSEEDAESLGYIWVYLLSILKIFLLLVVHPLSRYLVIQERAEGAMQLPKSSYISSFDELNYIITLEILFEAKNNSLPEISHQLSEACMRQISIMNVVEEALYCVAVRSTAVSFLISLSWFSLLLLVYSIFLSLSLVLWNLSECVLHFPRTCFPPPTAESLKDTHTMVQNNGSLSLSLSFLLIPSFLCLLPNVLYSSSPSLSLS